jgi:hypothetical protein
MCDTRPDRAEWRAPGRSAAQDLAQPMREAPVNQDDGPDPQPPKDINLVWLFVLGGVFFLFVLLAGLIGLTP